MGGPWGRSLLAGEKEVPRLAPEMIARRTDEVTDALWFLRPSPLNPDRGTDEHLPSSFTELVESEGRQVFPTRQGGFLF